MSTREEWAAAHEIEKLEGGCPWPIHGEMFEVVRSEPVWPQVVQEIRKEWPDLAASVSSVKVSKPWELN